MAARQMMKMRALVERDASGGTEDAYGGEEIPDWKTHLEALACWAWFTTDRQVVDGNKTASIEERKVIVPLGSDVVPGDRIARIADRLGNVLFTGPAKVEAAGRRRDHIELTLEEVS